MSSLNAFFLAVLLCLNMSLVFAVDFQEEQFSEHQLAFIERWNLTSAEYDRFLDVLAGPFGYYTPNLEKNPILALGLGAATEEERARYAKQYVQMEAAKNVAMVAFQQAVNTEWERAFPASSEQGSPASPTDESLRLKLYVTVNCERCEAEFASLYDQAMHGGPAVDVYFAGNPTQSAIREWAAAQGIMSNHVNVLRLVTLNYADQAFNSYPHIERN